MDEHAEVPQGAEIAAPPPPPKRSIPTRPQRMFFTGSGGEYFKIWIVNLLLTIVTFGIYSAWAKVRRYQYFYRHSRIAGAGFDYHGTPLAILKGRILAGLLFGGYYVAGLISPIAGALAFLVLIAVLPWLLVRSLRFRLSNSSYRGLRFRFDGGTAEAYGVFLGLGVASLLSIYILGPLWQHRIKRYVTRSSSYGRTRFMFDAPVWGFYRIYLIAAAVVIGLVVAAAVVMVGVVGTAAITAGLGAGEDTGAGLAAAVAFVALSLGYVLGTVGVWSFVKARVQNLVWNNTQLGPHRFSCELQARTLMFITLTNLLGIIFTLGLYKPFAEVRLMQYVATSFKIVPSGNLDDFLAGERQEVAAVGDEAVDMFDFEIAF